MTFLHVPGVPLTVHMNSCAVVSKNSSPCWWPPVVLRELALGKILMRLIKRDLLVHATLGGLLVIGTIEAAT